VTLWLAAAEPDGAQPLVRLRYGPRGEAVGTAFRRALAEGGDVVAVEARRERPGASPEVAARGVSAVRPYSLAAGLDAALWRSAVVAARAVEAAPGSGEEAAAASAAPLRDPAFYPRSAARWSRVLANRLLRRRPWYVLVRERRDDALRGWGPDEGLVRWERGHTYADPFLLEHDGRHHLFCEHVRPGSGRGVVSHVELEPEGAAGPPVPVLEEPYHLSYPFVFAWDGAFWMIPETAAAGQVRLYRATAFPSGWQLAQVLLDDVVAVDSTLFEDGGRWWLFTSAGRRGASLGEELQLFGASSPLGPWEPHPASPVVSDIRGGRSAGVIFREDGRVLRPAQDGSRRYGWAVSLREVTELTPERYEEREVGRIEPGDVPGARAVHAYARDSRFEAIDARRRERRWSARRPA
jgi:hypothetical protein